MKLPEDGPKYGPKHVAVIRYKQCKELVWFIFYCCLDTTDVLHIFTWFFGVGWGPHICD
jgi:hypothetical protein